METDPSSCEEFLGCVRLLRVREIPPSPSLYLCLFLIFPLTFSHQGLLREAHPHAPSSALSFLFSPLQSILGVLYSFAQDQLLLPVHELLGETMATALKLRSNFRDLKKTQTARLMQTHKN